MLFLDNPNNIIVGFKAIDCFEINYHRENTDVFDLMILIYLFT